MAPRTLIADDQPHVLEALRLLLKREGYEIEAVNSPRAVLESLRARQFDVLLMDLNYALDTTSGQEGLDLLARVRQLDESLPVVVMTAWSSVPLAVAAMQRGARDFVEKPWENEQLLAKLRRQVESRGRERSAQAELEEAAATQRSLMPRELPELPGYGIAAAWVPARQVGGDYLDVLRLAGDRLALCIADVMGKGLPAALLMSNLQALVRSVARDTQEPRELASRVNRAMAANVGSGKFVTLFYGVVDRARGRLIYTNAGHHAPVLVRAEGGIERLAGSGTVLGVFPNWIYDQDEVELLPGDRLVLFTDGIPEAENASGEPFGEERLLERVSAHRCLSADALKQRILEAVAEFSGCEPQDDIALVVLSVA